MQENDILRCPLATRLLRTFHDVRQLRTRSTAHEALFFFFFFGRTPRNARLDSCRGWLMERTMSWVRFSVQPIVVSLEQLQLTYLAVVDRAPAHHLKVSSSFFLRLLWFI